ncbi:MAG: hypothetical protein VX246_06355 [Myxococcota bacterium]|nr:hypothetical protein [Myxococcota bacterium]
MPLGPMDDFLTHQTHETNDYVYTSDRNFYDRYYFNMHASSDEVFLVTGIGQYPNLGVTDAFVCVSHGDKQYTVRASRELGSDRMDTQVGPFRIEVVEGLKTLRLVCDDNEWGVGFDVTFEGAHEALQEPMTFKRSLSRVTMNTSRFAQVGNYSGTLEVAGKSYDVRPDKWKGARDRSWGVRPVGESEAPGIRVTEERVAGFFHNWMPMQFDDYLLKVYIEEGPDGERTLEEAAKVYNFGVDKPVEHMGSPSHKMTYHSGTREVSGAEISFANNPLTVTNTPLRTVNLGMGSGYMPSPEWAHGMYQGPLKVEGLEFDSSSPQARMSHFGLSETLSRFDASNGDVGYGMHENFIVGIYRPYGFDAGDTLAP